MFTVLVTHKSGRGDETFPIMVTSDFAKGLDAARNVEYSERGHYRGFHSVEHGAMIYQLESDILYQYRPELTHGVDGFRIFFRHPTPDATGTIPKWPGRVTWIEEWSSPELQRRHVIRESAQCP